MNFDWSAEFHLNVAVLTLLAGTVVPFVVGLITKTSASPQFKSVANAVLSAIAGALAVAIDADGKVMLVTLLTAALTTFVASNATYQGLWKPSGAALVVANITGNHGLGVDHSPPPPLEFSRTESTRDIATAEQPVKRAPRKAPAKKVPAKRTTKKKA